MRRFDKKKHITKVNLLNEQRHVQERDVLEDTDFLDSPSLNEKLKDKLPNKVKLKKSWESFVSIAKREGKETVEAAKILKKVMTRKNPTPEEIKYLKSQSLDIAKILGMMTLGTTLSLTLNKILSKWNISILPKEQDKLK
jgi:hypothetical protein